MDRIIIQIINSIEIQQYIRNIKKQLDIEYINNSINVKSILRGGEVVNTPFAHTNVHTMNIEISYIRADRFLNSIFSRTHSQNIPPQAVVALIKFLIAHEYHHVYQLQHEQVLNEDDATQFALNFIENAYTGESERNMFELMSLMHTQHSTNNIINEEVKANIDNLMRSLRENF